jgi:hypothetical protein
VQVILKLKHFTLAASGFAVRMGLGELLLVVGLIALCVAMLALTFNWSENSLLLRSWLARLLRHDLGFVFSLSDGLLLEVGRCDSLDRLWLEFQVMVGKLGFAEVYLESKCLQKTWRSLEPVNSAHPLRVRYRFGGFDSTVLEFVASRAVMDPDYFGRVSLLAAKSWVEAARLWRSLPVRKTPPDLDVAPQP